MAAGLSKNAIRGRVRRRLYALVRELGSGDVKLGRIASGTYRGHAWEAWYEVGNMSNGETVGLARYRVNGETLPYHSNLKDHIEAMEGK